MTNQIKKNGTNFGIILGVISILITTILYAVNLELMVSIWVGIVIFVLNIIIGIVAVTKTKKKLGGFISFKEAFSTFFITMAVGSIIGILFSFILFNVIDPGAKETVMELVVEKSVGWMQSAGLKSEDIRKSVEDMRNSDNFGAFSQLKSYVGGLVLYSIIGLIVAAAFKNATKEI
jgi:hypothetical protein